jgi:hypothetical protein
MNYKIDGLIHKSTCVTPCSELYNKKAMTFHKKVKFTLGQAMKAQSGE